MLTVISLLIFVAVSQVAISLGILLESQRSKSIAQRLFVLLSLVTLLWTVANTVLIYADTRANQFNLGYFNFANKAGFCLGASSLLVIFIFSLYYPAKQVVGLLQKIVIAFAAILIVLSPFDVASGNFVFIEGKAVYQSGIFSIVYALLALLVVGVVLFDSAYTIRHTKDRLLRQQVRTLLSGLCLTILYAVTFIIILPIVYSDSPTVYAIGYLAPYFYMGATVYSLVRQKLFDVRLIVARSVAYIMLLVTTAGAFAGLVIFVPTRLVGFSSPSTGQQLYYTFAAIVLAFAFQPIRKFFDRVTNNLFYQDAYDPQVFLDELNQVIVSNIEIDPLLSGCIETIESHLKVEFCWFEVKETSYSGRRLVGNNHKKLREEDRHEIRTISPDKHQRVIIADELEQADLRRVLTRNNIALIARLAPDTATSPSAAGFLILGPKKSGNIFNKQDIRVLEIITKELVVAIQNSLSFEEIQNFNIKLTEEVETATQHLRQTNERLRLLDQTKDDFISMASHQLRTPLTSVKGYLSMVLEGDAGKLNPKERKLLTQAFSSSQRMVYLIADLLNLSRLKTGKFIIEPSAVNLAEIIEGEVKQLIETAASRNLKLTYHKPKTFPTLLFDETKIRQVIMNFIDNAIHYTPGGGHIDVYLGETPHTVELTVVDDGIGVSRHEQVHLFTKFFRASNARQARPDGTGLGLYMAKKVIIAHGGSTLFKSQPSKGSTFGFTFPKSKLALPVTTHQPEPQPEIPQIKS